MCRLDLGFTRISFFQKYKLIYYTIQMTVIERNIVWAIHYGRENMDYSFETGRSDGQEKCIDYRSSFLAAIRPMRETNN